MQRKCAHCKEIIEIDVDNVQGIAYFKSQYYHSQCLLDIAKERKQKKRHATYWDTMENDIYKYENAAKNTVMLVVSRDKLNEHILMHYNVVTVPDRLWEVLSEISNGRYKHKKCRPTNIEDIYKTWVWGQHKLDETAVYNKTNNKGPKNDSERILYDLAIVVGKVPAYLKFKAKQIANANELAKVAITIDEDVDIVKIAKPKKEKKKVISDLFDDLYVE